ncbi:MAG: Crp/Fnr family transcriptional regulator [Salibacteraceae bacterium]
MTVKNQVELQPNLRKEMEEQGKLISLKAGDIVLDIGQNIKVMPIVQSGLLRVSRLDDDGHEILLYYIHANEGCALTFNCCMQSHTSEIRAVAEEDSEILAIPITCMDDWMQRYPSWKNFVMQTIQDRFNELLKVIELIAFQKLDERLVHYLKEKSTAHDSKLINLSHEQIATELATSRVVISRLLKKLENDGKVLLYRHQIKLLSAL